MKPCFLPIAKLYRLCTIACLQCRYGGAATHTGAPAELDYEQATDGGVFSYFDNCFVFQAPGNTSYQAGTSKGHADALPQVLLFHTVLDTCRHGLTVQNNLSAPSQQLHVNSWSNASMWADKKRLLCRA